MTCQAGFRGRGARDRTANVRNGDSHCDSETTSDENPTDERGIQKEQRAYGSCCGSVAAAANQPAGASNRPPAFSAWRLSFWFSVWTSILDLCKAKNMKTTTTALGNRVKYAASPVRLSVVLLAITWFWFSPDTRAVSPTPDGLYFGANTAEGGAGALFSLTAGTNNTAVGSEALFSLTTGKQNTAVGAQALKNDTADRNTAIGFQALVRNTTGDSNTATGWRALFKNTTGDRNTASGRETLRSNTTGFENTGTGAVALQNNTTGNDNTATGFSALNKNTTGAVNTAVGTGSLVNSSTGDLNIALGFGAGVNLTAGANNIYIGDLGAATESNIIRMGTEVAVTDQFGVLHPAHTATFIAGISDAEASGGDPVFITRTWKTRHC